MKKDLKQLGAALCAIALLIGASAPYALAATYQTPDVRALFETTLASRITSSATSLTLTSATDKDGFALASSTYGLIVDEGTATEELMLADCTATACTNLARGLSVRTGTTTVAALQFEHRRSASVKITDAPALLFAVNVFKGRQYLENILTYAAGLSFSSTSDQLVSARFVIGATNSASSSAVSSILSGNNTFTGSNTFTGATSVTGPATTFTNLPQSSATPSNTNDLTTKTYVDAQVVAGGTNGSETVKGIYELATKAEANAGTSSGATGARLVLPASMASTTNQVATSSVVMTLSTGKIDPSFLPSNSSAFGGTGADGALALTSGITYLDLGGASTFVKNYTSISITGTGGLAFKNASASGTVISLRSQADCVLTSSGVAIDASSTGAQGGLGGPHGITITAGKDGSDSLVYAGQVLGGGKGFGGGALGHVATTSNGFQTAAIAGRMVPFGTGAGGAGGGAPGGDASAGYGGKGGRGGGGLIVECAGALNFTTGTVSVAGQDGYAGENPAISGNGAGGAGGAGGGGLLVIIYGSLTANSGTLNVSGGLGGTGGVNGGSPAQSGGGGGGGAGVNTDFTAAPGTAGSTSNGGNGGNGGRGASLVKLNTEL